MGDVSELYDTILARIRSKKAIEHLSICFQDTHICGCGKYKIDGYKGFGNTLNALETVVLEGFENLLPDPSSAKLLKKFSNKIAETFGNHQTAVEQPEISGHFLECED